MKYFLVLSLLGILFFSCSEPPSDSAALPESYIKGIILNPEGDVFKISGAGINESISVKEDGSFSDTLRLPPGYYRIQHGREYGNIYLEPGYDLMISVNMLHFDSSLTFSGIGAENSQYLLAKLMKSQTEPIDQKSLYTSEEVDFLKQVDQIQAKRLQFLETFENLTPTFVENEKKNLLYEGLIFLSQYKPAHKYFTQKEDFEPSTDLMAKLDTIKPDDEIAYKTFPSYRQLVDGKLLAMMDNNENVSGFVAALQALKSDFIKSSVIDQAAFQVNPGNEQSETLFQAIMEMSSNETLKEKLSQKMKIIRTLVKGAPSPGFHYVDIHGDSVSLAALAGKNVYLDIWATWCGPCKAEIPYLKEMESVFGDKNVAFVSISIDKKEDKPKWEAMVAEKELQGIQLFADNDWNSDFIKNYAIEGIPRFILVDAEGKIVSPDAPRPSNKEALLSAFKDMGVEVD